MITFVRSERLVVISDLHLGHPFSLIKKSILQFLSWAAAQGYDICINGDGLEIAQANFDKFAFDVPDLFRTLGDIRRSGRKVYYIIGNHDIALEHFLEDWGVMKVSPFLNVHSGGKRIRIEHGHMYDPFFIKFPVLYDRMTRMAGYVLKVNPQLYRLWISFEEWQSRMRAKKTGILGEHPNFAEAATELCQRGFDTIIFGHTHHKGVTRLEPEGEYFNPGSWMLNKSYVLIENGVVTLNDWDPRHSLAKVYRPG